MTHASKHAGLGSVTFAFLILSALSLLYTELEIIVVKVYINLTMCWNQYASIITCLYISYTCDYIILWREILTIYKYNRIYGPYVGRVTSSSKSSGEWNSFLSPEYNNRQIEYMEPTTKLDHGLSLNACWMGTKIAKNTVLMLQRVVNQICAV